MKRAWLLVWSLVGCSVPVRTVAPSLEIVHVFDPVSATGLPIEAHEVVVTGDGRYVVVGGHLFDWADGHSYEVEEIQWGADPVPCRGRDELVLWRSELTFCKVGDGGELEVVDRFPIPRKKSQHSPRLTFGARQFTYRGGLLRADGWVDLGTGGDPIESKDDWVFPSPD